ncbi:hypothetical protein ACM66B_005264 [Microbotryomycetes sp. NB124-2]
MDSLAGVSTLLSSSSYRPTKRPRKNPLATAAASGCGSELDGRADEWIEAAARALKLDKRSPVAWSRSNLIAIASSSSSTRSAAQSDAQTASFGSKHHKIIVQHLSGSKSSSLSNDRVSFELDVPSPALQQSQSSTSSERRPDDSGRVSMLSFSPESSYLLSILSTDHVDLITVWEQGSSSCINEWDIVWSERVDRFGESLVSAQPTAQSRVADPEGDQVKRVVDVKWLGQQQDYTISADAASGKPLSSAPSRSPPVNGAAFLAVLSSKEVLFVHLPRTIPLVPLTAVVPLSTPNTSSQESELSITALPTASTYAASNSNPFGTSPNNTMDALVATLVDGLPDAGTSAAGPSLNSLGTSVGVPGHGGGSADALREHLKLQEASTGHGQSFGGQVVKKAAIGAMRMRSGLEKGETSLVIATYSRATRTQSTQRNNAFQVLAEAASATATAAAATSTQPFINNTAASSPDDFNNDFADFSALDEAFGTATKPSPVDVDVVASGVGQDGGGDDDETTKFVASVESDELSRRTELSEVRIEMMAVDGPRVVIKSLAPVHLCDPLDEQTAAFLGDVTSLDWLEMNGVQQNLSDGGVGLNLLAVAVATDDQGQVQSSIVSWKLSNEPLTLSSAFSKLDCKKNDLTFGAKEWTAQKTASASVEGLLNVLSTSPFPIPRAIVCSVMSLSSSDRGKLSSVVRLLDASTLQPLDGIDDVAAPDPRANFGCTSSNGALTLLYSTDARASPMLVPTPVTGQVVEVLGSLLAASLARQSDQSDLVGRIVALKDETMIVAVMCRARDVLQTMLPDGRKIEDSALALELVGIISVVYGSTPNLALRGSIALDVVKLAALCRAFKRCEVRTRSSTDVEYACESDPVWSLIGHASWFCDFALSLTRECSLTLKSPRNVLLLCPTTRTLLSRATNYVLAFKAFLASFPLHQNAVVDTAKTVLDDVVEFGGLNLVEFKNFLTKVDAALTNETDLKALSESLVTLAVPDSKHAKALEETFSNSSSSLFLPNNNLPTPPHTPSSDSLSTSSPTIDFVRKSRLDLGQPLKVVADFRTRIQFATLSPACTSLKEIMTRVNALMRDTFFGQVVYQASGQRLFTHPEERDDFQVPQKYLPDNDKRRTSSSSNGYSKGEKVGKGVEGTSADREAEEGRRHESATATNDDSNSDATAVHSRDGEQQDEEKDDNLVDWYGPDDKENPMNWSPARKWFVTGCLCLMTTSVYAGSSIYTPGLMEAMEALGVGQVVATLGLSLFVFGYAVGPLVLSPITEIPAIGRTAPYIFTLAIYCALQVPAALTNSPAAFFIVRFLQGFFGSPPLATGGASVSDMFGPATRPYALGAWGLSAAAGPALGPVMSGFAIQAKGWHWHAWIMLWLSGFSLIFLIFALPETSSINILVRRARRLRKKTGNYKLRSQGEIEQQHMTGKDILFMTLIRPLQFTFTEPIVIALNLYISFVYAVLYCWFESFPLVFEMGYGWQLGVSTLPFLSLLVGSVIGYSGFCVWNRVYFVTRFRAAEREGRTLAPEHRLPPAFVGSVCYPICLFWFGWSANRTSWVAPVIATSFFGIGTTLMFMSVLSYLPDAYPKYVASVLASNDFQRSMIGGGTPLFAGIMFKKLGIDWGSSLLGFVSVALVPIPFVLFKYGHKIREKSKMAESEN